MSENLNAQIPDGKKDDSSPSGLLIIELRRFVKMFDREIFIGGIE